jgi:hypothetical protein
MKERLNEKGQLISVDFLYSLVLFMATLGVAIVMVETHQYQVKQEQAFDKVANAGRIAAQLFVSNPELLCTVVARDGTELYKLNNCYNNYDASGTITPEMLGLDGSRFDFEVVIESSIGTTERHIAGVTLPAGLSKNIYSERRIIIDGAQSIQKYDLELCKRGQTCPYEIKYVKISVWEK